MQNFTVSILLLTDGEEATYLRNYPSSMPIPRVDEAIYDVATKKDYYVHQIRYIPLSNLVAVYVGKKLRK